MARTCVECRVGYNAHLSEEWAHCPRCGGRLSNVSLADLGAPGSAPITGGPVETKRGITIVRHMVGDERWRWSFETQVALVGARPKQDDLGGDD